MSGSEFSITRSVRAAYVFVGREWRYLARMSLLPLGIDAATKMFLLFNGKEMSAFEIALWNLPSNVLFGWFMFYQARLMLLGETPDRLPDNVEYLTERRNAMKASVLIWLLFSMGWTAMMGYNDWAMDMAKGGAEFWTAGLGILLFGISFWCLRFAVAHILAAVGFPIKQYMRQVAGMGISLRLMGMGFLTVMPAVFLFYLVAAAIAPDVKSINDPHISFIVILGAPLSIALTALLNAAAASALKQMLGTPERQP